MSRAARALGAALLGATALLGCAPASITTAVPKTVVGHPLRPYEVHEECAELKPGDRLDYSFESTEPVDFNVHYHEGNAVVMPVVREKSRADAGVFAPPIAHHYCLMWEAGVAGASIDYRMRLRPAGP
jgi:hypothetical protein